MALGKIYTELPVPELQVVDYGLFTAMTNGTQLATFIFWPGEPRMYWMSQFPKLPAWIFVLPLALAASCSRPGGMQDVAAAQGSHPQVPFNGSKHSGIAASSHDVSDKSQDQEPPPSDLPFRDPRTLPAGTLVTVRLAGPVSADGLAASGTFSAVVDDPVVVDGITVIPRGATAAGLVESSRTSSVKRNRGYIRLTLESIDIAGRSLLVQTSSLFAKGNAAGSAEAASPDSPNMVHLNKGRRLTFRLADPVVLASQREMVH